MAMAKMVNSIFICPMGYYMGRLLLGVRLTCARLVTMARRCQPNRAHGCAESTRTINGMATSLVGTRQGKRSIGNIDMEGLWIRSCSTVLLVSDCIEC